MFSINSNGKVTTTNILSVMGILAFVVFLSTTYQTSQILRDREGLRQALTQQDQPLQSLARVQTQLDALAVGTLKLSQKGDKNAQAIIDRMKQLGITVHPPAQGGALGHATVAPGVKPIMEPTE
jgi:hypothetical protein